MSNGASNRAGRSHPFDLSGRTAWITGATRGLGLEMARALASVGARIAINSRTDGEAAAVAVEIEKAFGVKTFGAAADVTDETAIAGFVTAMEARLGPTDILVTNAGVNVRKPTIEMPLADWNHVLATNLTGPFICSKAVLPGMIARRHGRVIHLASIMGTVGFAERPPYSASKGGLVLLTKTQALEVATHGVTVNAICPGPFATEMNRPLLADPVKYEAFRSRIPMGRWGELHEIHGPVLFLASESASFVTGSCLFVDGGWTAQ